VSLMLSVPCKPFMLSVIMLNVVMLNVMAQLKEQVSGIIIDTLPR
jgi:hypothetical protein